MSFLHRVENTVNNDVVKPVHRVERGILNVGSSPPLSPGNTPQQRQAFLTQNSANFNQQLPGTFVGADPLSPERLNNKLAIDPATTPLASATFAAANPQTQQVVDKAANRFSWTPEFKTIAKLEQPNLSTPDSSGLKSATAAADYWPGIRTNYVNNQKVDIGPGYGSSPAALTHETLHAAWFTKPDVPKKFAAAYKASVNPDIKDYLDNRLQGYKAYKGKQSLDNYDKLPNSIKTEIHSYLSELPLFTTNSLPKPLDKYYSRFININDAVKKTREMGQVKDTAQTLLNPKLFLGRQNKPNITYQYPE